MTILLDIAALLALALALTFVPLHGLRHEARITREIRDAQEAGHSEPGAGPRPEPLREPEPRAEARPEARSQAVPEARPESRYSQVA